MVQEKKDLIICSEVFDCINILGKKYIDKLDLCQVFGHFF